jgi:hypothetical protein
VDLMLHLRREIEIVGDGDDGFGMLWSSQTTAWK